MYNSKLTLKEVLQKLNIYNLIYTPTNMLPGIS